MEVLLGAGIAAITAVIILGLGLWGFHREDKRDREQKANAERRALLDAADKLEEKQQLWHNENRDRLAKIETMLEPMWEWWIRGNRA